MILSMFALALLAAASPAAAQQQQQQTPPDLRDLVGARGAGGEMQLKARGYVFVRIETGSDRKWTFYWNEDQDRCVRVTTLDGRYDAITVASAADCRRSGPRPIPIGRPDRGDRPGDGGWAGGRRIDMGLMCFGEGERPALAISHGWNWNERRDRYEFGNRTELSTQQFDAGVMIQLWGDGRGRIRLPRKMIPPVHSRGYGSWWDLTDVRVDPVTIRATYRLNGLNRQQVTIDRRSGRMTIRGAYRYTFRGSCDVIDGRDHRQL